MCHGFERVDSGEYMMCHKALLFLFRGLVLVGGVDGVCYNSIDAG